MVDTKRKSRAKPRSRASRDSEAEVSLMGAAIPDPLGDSEHVVPSGRLTSHSRDHEGLLGSGETPLPDGGVDEHPIHDHGVDDDFQPDDYEAQFEQAPATGFEPREDDELASNDNEPQSEDDEAAREDQEAGAGDVAVRRRGSPD
jgi:hypothetical protein